MIFGQLIEHSMSMRNMFLEKSYTKCGGETSLETSSKNQNWAYLSVNSLKFCFVFVVRPSWGLSKYVETKVWTTCLLYWLIICIYFWTYLISVHIWWSWINIACYIYWLIGIPNHKFTLLLFHIKLFWKRIRDPKLVFSFFTWFLKKNC